MEDLELLPAGALGDLALDLVVDPLGVGERAALLPIGPQRHHKLPPVDHPVAVVKLVGHRVHLQLGAGELGLEDPFDELVARTVAVTVLVKLPEEVLDAGLLVVVKLEVALTPLLPVKVLDLLELLEVVELVTEAPVALPGHHPDVAPLVPERLGARVLDAAVLAHAGSAEITDS